MENLRLGAPSRLNNDLTLYSFPQNENARRGMANDKYHKMRADLEAEKGKIAILKEQIIKTRVCFLFAHFRLTFVRIIFEYSLCTVLSPTCRTCHQGQGHCRAVQAYPAAGQREQDPEGGEEGDVEDARGFHESPAGFRLRGDQSLEGGACDPKGSEASC